MHHRRRIIVNSRTAAPSADRVQYCTLHLGQGHAIVCDLSVRLNGSWPQVASRPAATTRCQVVPVTEPLRVPNHGHRVTARLAR